tara:strand:+ start:119 stop:379 length:261 start_codon:yes stop_codon:yes gene_type:complete
MSKELKITEEQLETIVKSQAKMQDLLVQVGVLESQKKQIVDLAIAQSEEVEDFKKELENEYGKISINLKDGTYEIIEEDSDLKVAE